MSPAEFEAGLRAGKYMIAAPPAAAAPTGSAAATPAPSEGAAPATLPPGGLPKTGEIDPNVPQLPPLPKGVKPALNAEGLQNDIVNLQIQGLPADQQRADLELINKGFMRYTDGVVRPYPGGPEDPQVKARQARAPAYGAAAGSAAPGFTHMIINGQGMDVPTPVAEEFFSKYGPSATPSASGAGATAAAGGAASSPATGTGGLTPPVTVGGTRLLHWGTSLRLIGYRR